MFQQDNIHIECETTRISFLWYIMKPWVYKWVFIVEDSRQGFDRLVNMNEIKLMHLTNENRFMTVNL